MDTSKPYLQAIGANLEALRSILIDAVQNVDDGLKAVEQGQAATAFGSILSTQDFPTQAGILIQAIIILHRQK